MENWEIALTKFIKQWRFEECVIAAIAIGSFVVGNNTGKSDIGVQIILSDEVSWRERGNKYVDGFLIEYFSNPIKQIYQYLDDDLKYGNRIDANMYYTGKVIFDKVGITVDLKRRAKEDLSKELSETDTVSLEMMKYGLWDYFEEIEEAYQVNSLNFNYLYYSYLDLLLEKYSRFLRTLLPAKYKAYRFFKDGDYRKKYNLNEFPDERFKKRFLECVEENDKERRYNLLLEQKNYVLEKMGGFEIDGWTLRTPLTIK
jgi:hypothetical protein